MDGNGAVSAYLTCCDALAAVAEDVALESLSAIGRVECHEVSALTAMRLTKPRMKMMIPEPITILQNAKPRDA